MGLRLILSCGYRHGSLIARVGDNDRVLARGFVDRICFLYNRVSSGLATLTGRPADFDDADVAMLGAEEAWAKRECA